MTDQQLLAEQRASGNFADGACLKCGAKFHINLRHPQMICTGLIDHKYCGGAIGVNNALSTKE